MTRPLFSIALALLLLRLPAPAADGETLYQPKDGLKPKGRVAMELVRLVDAQEVFERNITTEKFIAFLKQVEKTVVQTVPADAPAFQLLVKITLSSTIRPKFEFHTKGDASDETVQRISDALEQTPDLRSKADPLRLEVHFAIKAGS